MKTTKELTIAREYVIALKNADISGLSVDDILCIGILENMVKTAILDVISDTPVFSRCYISGLFSDCLKVSIIDLT